MPSTTDFYLLTYLLTDQINRL